MRGLHNVGLTSHDFGKVMEHLRSIAAIEDAGRYNNDAATDASLHDDASDCDQCGAGKLSTSDRTACESCEYVVA